MENDDSNKENNVQTADAVDGGKDEEAAALAAAEAAAAEQRRIENEKISVKVSSCTIHKYLSFSIE